jgi:hypothetical protein
MNSSGRSGRAFELPEKPGDKEEPPDANRQRAADAIRESAG